jgi:hypothetical protein
MQVDYSGATLSMSIAQASWQIDMPGIETWTDCLGLRKVLGLRSHLVAGTNSRPVLRDIRMLLLDEIEDAVTFLEGFGSRPQMGPVDLGASNSEGEHKVTIAFDRTANIPPGEFLPQLKLSVSVGAEFGFPVDHEEHDDPFDFGLLAGVGVEGKFLIESVGIITLYLIVGAEIEIGAAAEEKPPEPRELKFLFDVKVFLGLGVRAGIFDGSVSIGYHLAIDGGTVKNGLFCRLECELNLRIVVLAVEGEFGGLMYKDTSHPPNRHASDLEGEVQVNVEVLFIAIHASYQYTETKFFK